MLGSAWHTAKTLQIGDRARRIERLYPWATRQRRSYALARASSELFGDYRVLTAVVRDGRVNSFMLRINAAGD